MGVAAVRACGTRRSVVRSRGRRRQGRGRAALRSRPDASRPPPGWSRRRGQRAGRGGGGDRLADAARLARDAPRPARRRRARARRLDQLAGRRPGTHHHVARRGLVRGRGGHPARCGAQRRVRRRGARRADGPLSADCLPSRRRRQRRRARPGPQRGGPPRPHRGTATLRRRRARRRAPGRHRLADLAAVARSRVVGRRDRRATRRGAPALRWSPRPEPGSRCGSRPATTRQPHAMPSCVTSRRTCPGVRSSP